MILRSVAVNVDGAGVPVEYGTTWFAGDRVTLTLHADASLYAGLLDGAEAAQLPLDPTRKTYVHLVRGGLRVNGHELVAGDAAQLDGEATLSLADGRDAEVLVFDLAA